MSTVETKPFTLDEALAEVEPVVGSVSSVSGEAKASSKSAIKELAAKARAIRDEDDGLGSEAGSAQGDTELRYQMTALNIFNPLVAVVAGSSDWRDEQDTFNELAQLIAGSKDIVNHVAAELMSVGYDLTSEGNRWVMRQIIANVSVTLAKKFGVKGPEDNQVIKSLYSGLIGTLSGKVSESSGIQKGSTEEDEISLTKERFESLIDFIAKGDERVKFDTESAIACSMMKAMEPVVTELHRFSFFEPPMMVVHKCAEAIITGAGGMYERLLKDGVLQPTSEGKVMFLQSCIDKAGTLYSSSYRHFSAKAIQSLNQSGRSQEALSEVKSLGVPHDEINAHFQKGLALQMEMVRFGTATLKSSLKEYLPMPKKTEAEVNNVQSR